MQAEDRLIHFSTELIHPPKPHDRKRLQKLYFELSQTRWGYDNTEFTPGSPVRFSSKRPPRSQSALLFLADRIVVAEEWVDIALSDFVDRVQEVATRVQAELDVKPFIAQSVTLRSTFALTHFPDAQAFLMEHMCGQGTRIGDNFRRPVGSAGLRFVLPPTPDDAGHFDVRIESFRESQREIFVEVKGLFPSLSINADTMSVAADNIQTSRAIIRDSVFPFLDEYDRTPHDSI